MKFSKIYVWLFLLSLLIKILGVFVIKIPFWVGSLASSFLSWILRCVLAVVFWSSNEGKTSEEVLWVLFIIFLGVFCGKDLSIFGLKMVASSPLVTLGLDTLSLYTALGLLIIGLASLLPCFLFETDLNVLFKFSLILFLGRKFRYSMVNIVFRISKPKMKNYK